MVCSMRYNHNHEKTENACPNSTSGKKELRLYVLLSLSLSVGGLCLKNSPLELEDRAKGAMCTTVNVHRTTTDRWFGYGTNWGSEIWSYL